ncbi:hypothetical protein B0H14DRAFT_2561410 [Mycena olivaceomarginata]|nr:hypothetical protein B0H14DRAFT_2561410 [Mycena olivaceomarginata]
MLKVRMQPKFQYADGLGGSFSNLKGAHLQVQALHPILENSQSASTHGYHRSISNGTTSFLCLRRPVEAVETGGYGFPAETLLLSDVSEARKQLQFKYCLIQKGLVKRWSKTEARRIFIALAQRLKSKKNVDGSEGLGLAVEGEPLPQRNPKASERRMLVKNRPLQQVRHPHKTQLQTKREGFA